MLAVVGGRRRRSLFAGERQNIAEYLGWRALSGRRENRDERWTNLIVYGGWLRNSFLPRRHPFCSAGPVPSRKIQRGWSCLLGDIVAPLLHGIVSSSPHSKPVVESHFRAVAGNAIWLSSYNGIGRSRVVVETKLNGAFTTVGLSINCC